MAEIGLFYGSTSGVTEEIAEKIRDAIGEDRCDLYSMEADFDDVDDLLKYAYLILGCSTWGAGELQNDWREPMFDMEVDKPDFSGKTIALFGPGDRDSWVVYDDMNHHSRDQVDQLLAPFVVEWLEEETHAGKTALGEEKHWHIFNIVAHKQ